MAAIELKPEQLGRALRGEAAKVAGALERGAMRAAHRGKARLIEATDEKGVTDMGQYKSSFKVAKGPGIGQYGHGATATLINEAPIAGIVELGARPHPVSEDGIIAIARWAERKLGVGAVHGPVHVRVHGPTGRVTTRKPRKSTEVSEAAMAVAQAIAWKIRHHGQKGRYIFADEIGRLTRFYREEVEKMLRKPRGGSR
jgi:hypothetical protein